MPGFSDITRFTCPDSQGDRMRSHAIACDHQLPMRPLSRLSLMYLLTYRLLRRRVNTKSNSQPVLGP